MSLNIRTEEQNNQSHLINTFNENFATFEITFKLLIREDIVKCHSM